MEKTDHTLLVSHGAVQLAETLQVEKVRLIFKQKTLPLIWKDRYAQKNLFITILNLSVKNILGMT